MRKILSERIVVLALLLAILLPTPVFAAGAIDLNRSTSLTLSAVYGDMPVEGMTFRAYRISTVDASGALTPVERFSAYAAELDIRGQNDEAWQKLAQKLERAIVLDKTITAEATVKTDSTGSAKLERLSPSLYLIVADGVTRKGYVYTVSPFFVLLPQQDMTSNVWQYDITASVKPQQNPVREDFTVEKIWKDSCHKALRPKSITIDLLCDGVVYDTVTLPENGRWQHTWKDLDVNHKWTVSEAKQKGYKEPDIQQEGNRFTVTNTCNRTSSSGGQTTLPQTGQLWWPVPVLLCAGVLLTTLGLLRRRGGRDET